MKTSKKQNRVRSVAQTFGTLEQLEGRRMMSVSLSSAILRNQIDVFTVTNVGDNNGVNPKAGAGTGTLRQAIVDADADNSGRAMQINFDIGNGTQTIYTKSALPVITKAVLINGAPNSSLFATQQIELNGKNFTNYKQGIAGLSVNTSGPTTIDDIDIDNFGTGIQFTSTNGTIESCTIGNSPASGSTSVNTGIIVQGGSGNTLVNNQILNAAGDGFDVSLSNNNIIGGQYSVFYNHFTNISGTGISVMSSSGNQIVGSWMNQVGTGVTLSESSNNTVESSNIETASTGISMDIGSNGNHIFLNLLDGCSIGIDVKGDNNQIGTLNLGNTITNRIGSKSMQDGILIESSSNSVVGNGVDGMANGITILGQYSNTGNMNQVTNNNVSDCFYNGIQVEGGFSNQLIANTVYNNGIDGIMVKGGGSWSASGQSNLLSQNETYNNKWLGIDLGQGANGREAAPIISSASSTSTTVTISGSIAYANHPVTVEVFLSTPNSALNSAASASQGQTYLGSFTLPAGTTTFTNKTFALNGVSGSQVTATVTDAGGSNTSEYSNAVSTLKSVILVPVHFR